MASVSDLAHALPWARDEGELVTELQSGSEVAFDWLVTHYHAAVYNLVSGMLGDAADAADVTQEVFLKAFRGIRGFRRSSSLLRGYGFVSPRAAGGPIVAGTWTSNKFPGRAPVAGTLVRFFLGRSGSESVIDHPDDQLIDLARAELRELTGVTAMPIVARVFRWPRSMPQYVVGHLERLERLARLLHGAPGLLLAGAAYRGVGIPDCIASGWAAAGSALEQLGAAA